MTKLRAPILRALLVAMAFAPFITSLASWSLDGRLSEFKYQIRNHSYPTLVLEVGVVLLAMACGISLTALHGALQRWQKWMLALVAGAAVLSVLLVAPEPALAWQATIEWCIHFLFAAGVIHLARDHGDLISAWFWKVFVAGTLCYVVLVALFVPAVPNPAAFPWELRLPGFTNVRHLGYFVAPAIGVLLVSCQLAGSRMAAAISLLALWVLVCFVCWTGSRGSIFALGISFPVAVSVYPALRRAGLLLMLGAVTASAALASTALPLPSASFGILSRLSQAGNSEFTSGRLIVWKKTAGAIADEPLIGYGAGQFRAIMAGRVKAPLNHPHNFFLQIAFQWGIPGAVGFFSLLASLWLTAFRRLRYRGIDGAPSFMVLNTLLAFSLLDGAGNYPFPIALMLIAVADMLKVNEWPIPQSPTRCPASLSGIAARGT
jgi:hypothetical protein